MRYEFLIKGELSERALAVFPEFTTAPSQRAFTALCGPVHSDTQLRGILGRFDTLGLTVVEMRRLP
ncbi:hypothetical protein QMK17_17535 [Rhodococcus sp. G-MC3]|uniref:hypothetical protein n=1 Tax=Rhodococcus sp. G-MC3 TaxID=3046209 RepID=UPI0024BBEABA|nr:hypothetical protein [Rhodococcus sp. G-MC3]MDJ0395130.1 hypothetical protein [Rhodococcus sp. G-MC3]